MLLPWVHVKNMPMKSQSLFVAIFTLLLTACGASVKQVIPTERPTATTTPTPSATYTPGVAASPTLNPIRLTAGPSPTSIFGPTSTRVASLATATRVVNPNAPRIEFFTTDALSVAPGDPVNLYWSVRGARGAVIYRLDASGSRGNLWNVPPDGRLSVNTSRRDRGEVRFLLSVGEGDLLAEQTLSIPLQCPDPWFFQPAPDACPAAPSEPTSLTEESFERGRMVYVESRNRVYVLFNDGRAPAWISFENRYNPATAPELEESFVPPPGFVQPARVLGFVWRGSDVVRNRLGLGLEAEKTFDGFIQTVRTASDAEDLYISSADGSVLLLLPGGDTWQIITAPSSG
jgi:hypothetical protein